MARTFGPDLGQPNPVSPKLAHCDRGFIKDELRARANRILGRLRQANEDQRRWKELDPYDDGE